MKQNIYDILVNLLKLQVTILKKVQEVNKKLDEALKPSVVIDMAPPSEVAQAEWAKCLSAKTMDDMIFSGEEDLGTPATDPGHPDYIPPNKRKHHRGRITKQHKERNEGIKTILADNHIKFSRLYSLNGDKKCKTKFLWVKPCITMSDRKFVLAVAKAMREIEKMPLVYEVLYTQSVINQKTYGPKSLFVYFNC